MRFAGAIVFLAIAGCGSNTPVGDLEAMGLDTSGVRGGRTYANYDRERDERATKRFLDFGCLGSCAGQEAGWDWADNNDIRDAKECGGNSWAFTEGCVAYVVEGSDQRDYSE